MVQTINQLDNEGVTPLYETVRYNHEAIARLLLHYVPDLQVLNTQQIQDEQQRHALEGWIEQEAAGVFR